MILVDGQQQPTVEVSDRGLQYGDGLFETLPVIDGTVPCWERHWRRLSFGCQRLQMPCPDEVAVLHDINQLSTGKTRAVIKLIVTRGDGLRGYRVPKRPRTRRIAIGSDWPNYPPDWARQGVAVRLCKTRLGSNPALAGLKHCNRLEQVLARQEWQDQVAEGLMQDPQGHVIEGTMTNLFVMDHRGLITPDLSACGVVGIARELILEQAPDLGIQAKIDTVTVEQLREAQAVFLCNSLIGIWPVHTFEKTRYKIPEWISDLRTLDGLRH